MSNLGRHDKGNYPLAKSVICDIFRRQFTNWPNAIPRLGTRMISVQASGIAAFFQREGRVIGLRSESFEHKSILTIASISMINLQVADEKKHPESRIGIQPSECSILRIGLTRCAITSKHR